MNTVFECYVFLKNLAALYCDTVQDKNHMLGEERVFY
jgi:hypothetical protein